MSEVKTAVMELVEVDEKGQKLKCVCGTTFTATPTANVMVVGDSMYVPKCPQCGAVKVNPRVYTVMCEQGHMTQTPDPNDGRCHYKVESRLNPGKMVPCLAPTKPHEEGSVEKARPNNVNWEEKAEACGQVGAICEVCKNEMNPLHADETVMRIPVENNEVKSAHMVCYWKYRCHSYEELYQSERATLASVVAGAGGVVRVRVHALKTAVAAQFRLDIQPIPGGGLIIRLIDPEKRIDQAEQLPKERS